MPAPVRSPCIILNVVVRVAIVAMIHMLFVVVAGAAVPVPLVAAVVVRAFFLPVDTQHTHCPC